MRRFDHTLTSLSRLSLIPEILDRPYILTLHVTGDCNIQCDWCYARENPDHLPLEKCLKLLHEAHRTGTSGLNILGGEPLMWPHLTAFVKEADRLNMSVSIATNGHLLTSEFASKLRDSARDIMIYVNLDHKNTYSAARSGACWKRAFQGALNARKAGIYTRPFLNFSSINSKYGMELIDFYCRHGMPPTIERCLPVSKEARNLAVTPEEWFKLITDMKRMYSKYGWINTERELYSMLYGYPCSEYCCHMVVKLSGAVLPCIYLPESESIGNAWNEPYHILWARYKNARNHWISLPEECKDCSQAFVCGGGCRTQVFLDTGRYHGKDPYCLKNISPETRIPPQRF